MFSASRGMDPECPDSKEGRLSLQCLKCRLSYISQYEGMTDSPVESLEKDIVLYLSGQRALHPFDTSRGALSSMLQKVTMPDSS